MIPLALLAVASPPDGGGASAARIDELVEGRGVLPSLREVQGQAQAALQLPPQAEVESWANRARWSALLPRLDVRFGSQRDLLVRDSIEGVDWARSGQGFGLDVAARWGLGGLAYSPQEPAQHRERLRRAAALRLARARVTEVYFERVQVTLQQSESDDPELALEAAELDGRLLALTGGRYRLRAPEEAGQSPSRPGRAEAEAAGATRAVRAAAPVSMVRGGGAGLGLPPTARRHPGAVQRGAGLAAGAVALGPRLGAAAQGMRP